MFEDLRLHHQESVSLINEHISTLSNQVRIQSEQFATFTAIQDRRYSTLHEMISSHTTNFDSFTSTFMQHFPPPPPHQDQDDATQDTDLVSILIFFSCCFLFVVVHCYYL